MRYVFLVLFLMLCAGAAYASTQTEITLGHRSYILFKPTTPASPAPLVVSYHPGLSFVSTGTTIGWNGSSTALNNTLNNEAEQHGFMVVYPEGRYRTALLETWNVKDQTCCGYAKEIKTDDIEFVRRIIADLSQNEDIDETRIYHTGYSNGSMLALAFGCMYPAHFDGFVGLAGPLILDADECTSFPSVPTRYMYGSSDDNVPPAGGVGGLSGYSYPTTQSTINFLSTASSNPLVYELTGCEHAFASAVSCLSSQYSLIYASVIGDLAD